MNKLKYYINKYKYILFLIVIFVLLAIILILLNLQINDKDKLIEPEILQLNNEISQEKEKVISKIKVDIKGYVKKSGVYELDENSRVIDVINKAGGLKNGANTDYINLSKIIKDQDVIIIYSDDEIEKLNSDNNEKIYIEYKCECPDNINDACTSADEIVNEKLEEKENTSDNKVSINNGSIEELMTLPGIGESKAQAIIEYRESNGKFQTLDDIMNVSGIGEAAYSKIKDYIKL